MNKLEAAKLLISQGGECTRPKTIRCSTTDECPVSDENRKCPLCQMEITDVEFRAKALRIANEYLEQEK